MAGPQLDRRAPAEPPGVAGHHRAHGLHPGGDHLADVWHAPVVAAHLGAAYALDPVIQALRSIPLLGLLPLFIVWFGIGEMPKDLIVLLGALFPMYINTFAGIRSVDPKLGELGQVLGLSRWELIRHIVLPGALPSALTGVRLSVIGSLLALVVVVGEQINANAGLGFMITTAQEFLQNNIIMVCLIVYAILGLTADWGSGWWKGGRWHGDAISSGNFISIFPARRRRGRAGAHIMRDTGPLPGEIAVPHVPHVTHVTGVGHCAPAASTYRAYRPQKWSRGAQSEDQRPAGTEMYGTHRRSHTRS